MKRFLLLPLLFAFACGAPARDDASSESEEDSDVGPLPPVMELPPRASRPGAAGSCSESPQETAPMAYRGGPVLGRMNVYYVYYGDFEPTTPEIVADFTSNLGGSPYFNIMTTYWWGDHQPMDARIGYGGSVFVGPGDPAWRGTNLRSWTSPSRAPRTDDLYKILAKEIQIGALPLDSAIYVIVTGHGISVTGFCSKYMGWHSHGTMNSTPFVYVMAGSPEECGAPFDCYAPSPNENPEADVLVNVLAHEFAESYTNWFFDGHSAWLDTSASPEEVGDKCAWNYGQMTRLANGSLANVQLGDRAYLLQQLFVNDGSGYCGQWW